MALDALLRTFARTASRKLASGLGEPEDQLRAPLETLFAAFGEQLGLSVMLVGESHLSEDRIRPDFAVTVGTNPLAAGFVEVKAPGTGADTSRYRGRNKTQWERLSALPNVLYTDGNDWAVYRSGEPTRRARLVGEVRDGELADPDANLEALLTDFLNWQPEAPRTTRQLVTATAGLCRLLREEVLELAAESEALAGLESDWRDLLFPEATPAEFADGYAQAVTFALLLARAEGISFEGRSINEIAALLGKQHSLLGKALSVLTDESLIAALSTSVQTLVRVCGAVDWAKLANYGRAPWLRFYEDFLAEYDPALRRLTGSYYTPNEIVSGMVDMVDELLRTRLGQPGGYRSPEVVVVDPAMGTGTFLLHVIEHVAETVATEEGPGAVGPRLRELLTRLIGFERQLGPFAVAELRAFEEFRDRGVEIPKDGLRLYVTDTLDNPFVEQVHLAAGYEPIARSRRAANLVKSAEPVMVVIGNPPYKDYQKGNGGWVENGDFSSGVMPIFDDFIPPKEWKITGTRLRHIYNLYAYFWRWAIWKVFEAHDPPKGVVAFITSAGFTTGQGFAAMRRHLRALADDVWVLDLTPEGHRPDVSTRVFPGVQQPLAITIALRTGRTDRSTPADVHYVAINGRRGEKFHQVNELTFDDDAWMACSRGWTDPFTPVGDADWQEFPAVADLFPWSSSGVGVNRMWPIGMTRDVLRERWDELISAANPVRRAQLLKETRDRKIDRRMDPLPGVPPHMTTLAEEKSACPEPVRYGFRSFSRAWIIPDARVMDMPRTDLWAVRSRRQLFLVEQHSEPIENGPALVFSAEIPDLHHYNNRGGRAFPLWRDGSGLTLNVAPGLVEYLNGGGIPASGESLMAYSAAVAAHPGFTERFRTELVTPGVRIPLTLDREKWESAVALGKKVIWLHTCGQRFASPAEGRPAGAPRLPKERQPSITSAIPDTEDGMPDTVTFDSEANVLAVGAGRISNVTAQMWEYEVSTYRVVQRWVKRRLRAPEGRRSSPLDDMVPSSWSPEVTSELLDLLNVIGLLVDVEHEQAAVLDEVLNSPLVRSSDLTEAGVLPVANDVRQAVRRDEARPLFD